MPYIPYMVKKLRFVLAIVIGKSRVSFHYSFAFVACSQLLGIIEMLEMMQEIFFDIGK